MKFNQKIFLLSFLFITLTIYILGYLMITNNHRENIQIQIDRGITQINTIINEIEIYGFYIANRMATINEKNNLKMEVWNEDVIIYSSTIEIPDEIREKVIPTEEKINVYIKEQKLYVGLKRGDVTILTQSDISAIEEVRKEQIRFFTQISIICSLVISAVLYIGVTIITRKLKKLNEAATQILKGNYNIEVQNLGKDEFGMYGATFNKMLKSINYNIQQITEISNARKDFISNLTHEIRTPLTSIIGYSSLIKQGKVMNENTIKDYATRINYEGNYIKEISDKLMNVILMENEKIELTKMNLSELLTNILRELQSTYPKLKIIKKIEEDIYIKTDEMLLTSLISNMVKNAMQSYLKEDEKEYTKQPEVIVFLDKDAKIYIIDNGKGIPQEELERIKEPFYSLNKNRNREISGMGLGLTLCVKIIQLHNGKLEIKSKVGEGTAIILDLGERIYET